MRGMKRPALLGFAFAGVLVGTVGGCTAPESVTNLTKQTSANVSIVNSAINARVGGYKAAAERRSGYIADVHGAALDLELNYAERIGAMQRTESKKAQQAGEARSSRIKSIIAYVEDLEKHELDAAASRQTFETDLQAARKRAPVATADMKELGAALTALAKGQSDKEFRQSFLKFLQESATAFNELTAKSAAAAAAGNAASSSVAGSVIANASQPK